MSMGAPLAVFPPVLRKSVRACMIGLRTDLAFSFSEGRCLRRGWSGAGARTRQAAVLAAFGNGYSSVYSDRSISIACPRRSGSC